MRRLVLVLLVMLLAVSVSAALYTVRYSSGSGAVSVTSTKTTTTFVDNQTNGTNAAFRAKWVLIRSRSASANSCHYHLGDDAATKTLDPILAPGAAVIETWPSGSASVEGEQGWPMVTTICNTAETATFDIDAGR